MAHVPHRHVLAAVLCGGRRAACCWCVGRGRAAGGGEAAAGGQLCRRREGAGLQPCSCSPPCLGLPGKPAGRATCALQRLLAAALAAAAEHVSAERCWPPTCSLRRAAPTTLFCPAEPAAEWYENPTVSAQDAVKILVYQIQQNGPISE